MPAATKYARTNRIALDDYFAGQKLNGNRPSLLQTSQKLITKLGSDSLPGITAGKVTKLKNLRAAWIAARSTQTASASAAQSTRAELKTLLKSIEDRKVAIQLAADAEWPHTDPENAALRKEFGLSSRKPLLAYGHRGSDAVFDFKAQRKQNGSLVGHKCHWVHLAIDTRFDPARHLDWCHQCACACRRAMDSHKYLFRQRAVLPTAKALAELRRHPRGPAIQRSNLSKKD